MVTLFITSDLVRKEYPNDYEYFLNLLRNSKSKFKDTQEDKIYWTYSFSYFKSKGEYTPEYYESLFNMAFDDRYKEEISKVRVSLAMVAGKFFMSDRVDGISETVMEVVKKVTAQKMASEQEQIGNIDVINSIPHDENSGEKPAPLSLEDQLKHAIDAEDYEYAAKIRDEINKKHEIEK